MTSSGMAVDPNAAFDEHDVAEVTLDARGLATAVAPETGLFDPEGMSEMQRRFAADRRGDQP